MYHQTDNTDDREDCPRLRSVCPMPDHCIAFSGETNVYTSQLNRTFKECRE